jgi:hypothetical protein
LLSYLEAKKGKKRVMMNQLIEFYNAEAIGAEGKDADMSFLEFEEKK